VVRGDLGGLAAYNATYAPGVMALVKEADIDIVIALLAR
jgi:hypothetical protein